MASYKEDLGENKSALEDKPLQSTAAKTEKKLKPSSFAHMLEFITTPSPTSYSE